MYELIVRDSQLRWHNLDLLPGEEPVMNYQVNDIAELKDRQADYSQNIKLPKSPKNVRVLEALNVFEANTLLPYRTIQCRLYSNGFRLAGKGAILIIDRVGDYIECHIRSGNVDFFETMNNRLMEDADLGSTIVGSGAVLPSWIRRAGVALGRQFDEYKAGKHYFYNLYAVVDRLVQLCGFTLETDLPIITTRSKDYVSLPSLSPIMDSLAVFDSSASFSRTGEVGIGYSQYLARHFQHNLNSTGLGTFTQVGNTEVGASPYMLKFTSNIDGKIKVRMFVSGGKYYDPENKYKFQCAITKQGVDVEKIEKRVTDTDYGIDKEVEIEVAVGDEVYMYSRMIKSGEANANCSVNLMGSFTITEIEANEVPAGGKLYFANNMGFETYLDLFKEFCRSYGLTVLVDNNNKVVKANTMDTLYQNKGIAKDWSNKLSKDNIEMGFVLDGYGQNNFLRFEKAKGVDENEELEEKGNFYIDNRTIEKWKDLFTLKWESGKDVRAAGLELAYIPIYEYDEVIVDKRKIVKGKPHLVELTQINSDPWYVANHITAQSLLDNYYDKLINRMLVKAKTMNVELVLNEQDIEELDYFTPIYLKQFGAYFYISKISNFISNKKLTKVEMIKL